MNNFLSGLVLVLAGIFFLLSFLVGLGEDYEKSRTIALWSICLLLMGIFVSLPNGQ